MKNFFEKNPVEKQVTGSDNGGGMEELRLGRFSPLPGEIQRIRKEAEAQGKDPDLAEKKFREKLNAATARLRMSQREEAIRSSKRTSKGKPEK